jgi:hypothetical protein
MLAIADGLISKPSPSIPDEFLGSVQYFVAPRYLERASLPMKHLACLGVISRWVGPVGDQPVEDIVADVRGVVGRFRERAYRSGREVGCNRVRWLPRMAPTVWLAPSRALPYATNPHSRRYFSQRAREDSNPQASDP